jgi:hypothetical protein
VILKPLVAYNCVPRGCSYIIRELCIVDGLISFNGIYRAAIYKKNQFAVHPIQYQLNALIEIISVEYNQDTIIAI